MKTKMTTEQMIEAMSVSSSSDILMARERLIELTAEIEQVTRERNAMLKAIQWALGETGYFPPISEPPFYKWRTELRERAGVEYDKERHRSYPETTKVTLQKGDYVLATKYEDGDPGDQWAVGFFDSMWDDRYIVVDGEGKRFRHGGFRRCELVSNEVGEWLVAHAKEFSDANSDFGYDDDGVRYGRSVWDIAKQCESGKDSEQQTDHRGRPMTYWGGK